MFAGHVGAGLALGRIEPRVNVGVFVAAALLLDALLWVFVLLGWEALEIRPDFARTHQPYFVFPLSHGLLGSLGWTATAAAVAGIACRRSAGLCWRVAVLVGLAVFSHWLLDALVHRAEMPWTGGGGRKLGLGLWQAMPLALAVEAAIALTGLWLFLRGGSLARRRQLGLAALALLVLGFTIAGMTIAPPPPSARAMAASSLAAVALVCGLACWLGRGVGSPRD